MTVTRDVILDLLPLYLAGEASAGTRVLVTEYLARDPELAEQVRRQQADPAPGVVPAISPDLEMRALLSTRRAIARRAWVFGLAWFFTAVTFSLHVTFTGGMPHARFALLDYPLALAANLVVTAGLWIAYAALRRRARLR